MKLRNRGENEREEDRTDAPRRHQGAERSRFAISQPRAHVRGSVRPQGALRKHVLVAGFCPVDGLPSGR